VPQSKATNSVFQFVKTTLVGGVVFLVPLSAIGIVLFHAARVARRLARPLIASSPSHPLLAVVVADVVVVAALILFCFLAGLAARVSFASRLIKRCETSFLWRIPGYAFLKGLADTVDPHAERFSMRPVLVHFDDYAQLAFEVDALSDGRRVVYLPSAPNPRSGTVVVVSSHQVEETALTPWTAMATLRAVGHGAAEAIERPRTAPTAPA
jgi:uncharacterized membrane protein